MKCLYCECRLGFFRKGKGAFCSEQHEELYRNATQSRLAAPYTSSAGLLENSPVQAAVQAEGEAARAEDLAQLLKATQVASGAKVETPAAQVVITDHFAETVMASVENSAAGATNIRPPEIGHAVPPAQREPSQGSASGGPGDAPPITDATAPSLPENPSATVSDAALSS